MSAVRFFMSMSGSPGQLSYRCLKKNRLDKYVSFRFLAVTYRMARTNIQTRDHWVPNLARVGCSGLGTSSNPGSSSECSLRFHG